MDCQMTLNKTTIIFVINLNDPSINDSTALSTYCAAGPGPVCSTGCSQACRMEVLWGTIWLSLPCVRSNLHTGLPVAGLKAFSSHLEKAKHTLAHPSSSSPSPPSSEIKPNSRAPWGDALSIPDCPLSLSFQSCTRCNWVYPSEFISGQRKWKLL